MSQSKEQIQKQIKDDQDTIKKWSETEQRLKKELAFARYQVDKYTQVNDKERAMMASYILGKLQCIEGSHSVMAEYSKEFEEYYKTLIESS